MDQKTVIADRKAKLIELTAAFCDEQLDSEYRDLSRRLIEKMARKRQVPFLTGGLNVWAGAVIHALGTINFLFDSSFLPSVTSGELAAYFGAAQSTIGNRSKQIRDMFKMRHWDREFSTSRMAADADRMAGMFSVLTLTRLDALGEE